MATTPFLPTTSISFSSKPPYNHNHNHNHNHHHHHNHHLLSLFSLNNQITPLLFSKSTARTKKLFTTFSPFVSQPTTSISTADQAIQDEENRVSGWVEEVDEEDHALGRPVVAGEPEGDDEGFTEQMEGLPVEDYPEPPEGAKIFVGNLPYDVDSEKLAELFNQAGVVEIAEVIYNRDTDQSRGFGFVTMSTVEEADKAVEMFNCYDLNNRLLTVNKAAPRGSRPPRELRPSFRAYVGNLPWQVNDARLEQLFSEHGKVVEARVVQDRESGRSRGFGFVTMATQSELDDAIAALDGQNIDGRAIKVNVAEERSTRVSF